MRNKEKLFSIALVFVFLVSISATASAKEIVVGNDSEADFRSIQEAVNSSFPGDTVIVGSGNYTENVVVNVSNLTIMSESKNYDVLVESLNESESVFLIKVDNVTISGFNITGDGETFNSSCGICLENASNCNITGNNVFEKRLGITLVNASYNTISENFLFNDRIPLDENSGSGISLEEGSGMNNLTGNAIENGYIILGPSSSGNLIAGNEILNGGGIVIACCGSDNVVSSNTISNCSSGIDAYDQRIDIRDNRITDCHHGIDLSFASGTGISGNTILNCSIGISFVEACSSIELFNNTIISSAECGIFIPDYEGNERIYNNYFNNTLNVKLGISGGNTWNNSLTSGTNIVGGPYLGGNFWAKPDGTGFSQMSEDSDENGIGDLPYNINGNDFDYLPLVSISSPQDSKFDKIIVQGPAGFPEADFSANPKSGSAPLSVHFTDSSQNATEWDWDFGDEATSTSQNPEHTYTEAGDYTVNLTVTNENGTDSTAQEIVVDEAPIDDEVLPVADFNAHPRSGNAPLSVHFTDSSQDATEWNWNFGDGDNSIDESPEHIYSTAGNYIVNLTVYNENGTDSKTLEITVDEAPSDDETSPVADFNANPTSGYAPLSVHFTDSSQNATEWDWDFGDEATSTAKNPEHTYTEAGNYVVNLTVSNGNGTDLKTLEIIVAEASSEDKVLPVANFNANPTSGPAPLSVRFTDSSQNATGWNWNFGDGNTSIAKNPINTYSKAGNYTVNLTVSNENGTKSKILEIIVQKAQNENKVYPVANFNANPTSGYAPLSVLFTDLSQNAASRGWDFNNDGIVDTSDASPVYVYTAPGTYTVNLKVSNGNGTASKNATITVLKDSSSSGGSSSSGSSRSSGGSGGGGAGGSPEPQNNVETKEISQTFVTSGNPAKFDFPRNATSVLYVSFDSKKTAGKTTTIVELLKGKSTLVSGLPSGEVYKSLNIWVGNSGFATPNNIENAVVCFKIEKSWITDRKIDQSSITLNRYSDKKWNQLPTSLLSEDDKYLYFTAKTPGFSPFAITSKTTATGSGIQTGTGNKTQLAAVNETQTKPSTQNLEQNSTGSGAEQKSKQEKNANLPVFGMICMIALLLVAFLFKIDKP